VRAPAGPSVTAVRRLLAAAVLLVLALAPPAAAQSADDAEYTARWCPGDQPGTLCTAGLGRRTPGGGDMVSHKGWPAITGILWKVEDDAGRSVQGGERNDELLGHHGSDGLRGGAGRDVLWGDWDPGGQPITQRDVLSGEAGDDWLYSSHGRNAIRGGAGRDLVWAYYGHGTIDCGPGFDTVRVRLVHRYTIRGCERTKNFCAFGSKPGLQGGCYKPGERPRDDRR
jgi:hypothetical protein